MSIRPWEQLGFIKATPEAQPRETTLFQINPLPSILFPWHLPGPCLVPPYLKIVPTREALAVTQHPGPAIANTISGIP